MIKDNQVIRDDIEIKWESGLAVSQKRKNILNLHEAICSKYKVPNEVILEVSTKSFQDIGRTVSSMNMKFVLNDKIYSFESVYQSSKVYIDGILGDIQYLEWIDLDGYEAKKRSKQIALPLKGFVLDNRSFPLEPKTLFFDWLYIQCIDRMNIFHKIKDYCFFTDIEFSPIKMISTQAQAICKYKDLFERGLVTTFLEKPNEFY